MSENNEKFQPVLFDKVKIGIASPEKIRSWSHGEVTETNTINYRTYKPDRNGLFCEVIFGPTKDYECACGKYKKNIGEVSKCERCGVEITKSSVRRTRMGSIELEVPVAHMWYWRGNPSKIGLLLDMKQKQLESLIYYNAFVVLDCPEDSDLKYKQVITRAECYEAKRMYGSDVRVSMGAEALKELLQNIDLDKEYDDLKAELANTKGQNRQKMVKRLNVIDAFRKSDNKPEWMILDVLPVIPPELRPMVQLDGDKFASSDLNELYKTIILRNNNLKDVKLLQIELIMNNAKRLLQMAVDALIDSPRGVGAQSKGSGKKAHKPLTEILKGKHGRFRQNLLGKRVDYSGRSVIVVGPELKIYQCGIPKEMAIELFKPFIIKKLYETGVAENIKRAKKMIDSQDEKVWDVLEEIISEHPVMLNRAPTLHRLGIQAFEPILVEGKAIKLHPLVCTAFNADFDGDQMAVHVPLSVEAQAECRFLLLSPNNLLKPSDGGPVAVPSQDMVLGIYYLTQEREDENAKEDASDIDSKFKRLYRNVNEAILAYENKEITLQNRIRVRRCVTTPDGREVSGIIETTLGRLLFNEIIPQDLGIVERNTDEDYIKLEVDYLVAKKQIKQILQKVIDVHGTTKAAEFLDDIKAIGYKYSTRAAMTVSISDMIVPESKKTIIEEADKEVEATKSEFEMGFLTEEERHRQVLEIWKKADNEIKDALLDGLGEYNNIYMMANSGARGSEDQIKQLAGMRGNMSATGNKVIELPIKSNFREGLDVLEYFISAHGARKALSDTALKTADSGYLTRRLVDVAQDLVIRDVDCCEGEGPDKIPYIEVSEFKDGGKVIESLESRITGRYAAETIYDADGNMIVKANHMIYPHRAKAIIATGATKVKIRSMLTCKSRIGVCSKCYGTNLATGQAVQVGEAVGIIAAQSIGEPGTQLTMRTFHTGGVATGDDITTGLPRVEEIFEARNPKGRAIIARTGGRVEILTDENNNNSTQIQITSLEDGSVDFVDIPFSKKSGIIVENGSIIEAGASLTEGSVDLKELLEVKGLEAVQNYIIREVQKTYSNRGVDINDKHIELIVRQMLKKIKITESGDTDFLPETQVDVVDFYRTNEAMKAEGKEPAEGEYVILGITKAALATDSFLSAASFQETSRVLTEAAIKGSVDSLEGLKENVLIGNLIPAGTGLRRYRNVKISNEEEEEEFTVYSDDDENFAVTDIGDVFDEQIDDEGYGEGAEEDM